MPGKIHRKGFQRKAHTRRVFKGLDANGKGIYQTIKVKPAAVKETVFECASFSPQRKRKPKRDSRPGPKIGQQVGVLPIDQMGYVAERIKLFNNYVAYKVVDKNGSLLTSQFSPKGTYLREEIIW